MRERDQHSALCRGALNRHSTLCRGARSNRHSLCLFLCCFWLCFCVLHAYRYRTSLACRGLQSWLAIVPAGRRPGPRLDPRTLRHPHRAPPPCRLTRPRWYTLWTSGTSHSTSTAATTAGGSNVTSPTPSSGSSRRSFRRRCCGMAGAETTTLTMTCLRPPARPPQRRPASQGSRTLRCRERVAARRGRIRRYARPRWPSPGFANRRRRGQSPTAAQSATTPGTAPRIPGRTAESKAAVRGAMLTAQPR